MGIIFIASMYGICLPTFTTNINHMQVNIPYMDGTRIACGLFADDFKFDSPLNRGVGIMP